MRRVFAVVLLSAVGLSLGAAAPTPAPGPLTVASFSPTGDARGATQAVLRFDRPMIRFGDPRATAPARVACPVGGEGRWLDERTWVYDFATPLPAGLRCRLTVDRRARALDGRRLAAPAEFAIDSGGPAIVRSLPSADGEPVDEEQVYALLPDGPVDVASIAAHGRCEVEGVGEALPLRVLEGEARARALESLRAERWRYAAFTNPDQPWTGPRPEALRDALLVACARPLPNDADLRLVWGAGIRSASGVARADDQVLAFRVRPAFLAQLRCERLGRDEHCLPVTPIRVEFTAPVARALAAQVRLVDPASGRRWTPKAGESAEPQVQSLSFAAPFPANAKLRLELPQDLVDDAGRRLQNAARFPLTVPIASAPPLARFAADFGILERRAQPALPVTVRNLDASPSGPPAPVPGRVVTATTDEQIVAWLARLDAAWDAKKSALQPADVAREIAVPRTIREAEVIGIPLPTPGLHVVELASPTLGAALTGEPNRTWYVRSAALVTNLAIHLKTAPERSLVWVTALDTARPVAKANVAVRACDGALLWSGTTDARGLAFTGALDLQNRNRRCRGIRGLYVSARAGDDLAFALTDWDDGIGPWAFNLPYGGDERRSPALHAVLDRTLLRAGETLHMKHYARRATGEGFAAVPARELPDAVTITHDGSGQEWRVPLKFANGSALAEFAVPREAKLGRYSLAYRRGERWLGGGGQFAVEEFRLPTQRATLQLERGPLVAPTQVAADAMVTFLAGGGAAGAPVTLRWRTEPAFVRPAGYDEFTFGAEPIRVGVTRSGGEEEADDTGTADAAGEGARLPGTAAVRTRPLVLDANGSVRANLDQLALDGRTATLVAELEYPDANGQRLSVATRATLYPAALQVGLRSPRWPRAGATFEVAAVVLDLAGRPVAGQRVAIEAYSRTLYSFRKRLFGGFYAYENQAEVKSLGRLCEATSDARGRVRCDATLQGGHQVLLRATATDAQGRTAQATDSLWLADADAWWGGGDSERIDLIPERRRYEVGETARLEARVPFRASTALVTVEREGVLDAQVVALAARSPNVSVPIRRGWSPNVYVSVLAVRGRVGEPAPTALVDLAKPTFRVGYAALEIGRAPHELAIDVQTDREVYPTRGTAKVTIAARRPDGTPAANAEVALAAVDEALLELAPNDTVDLLGAMLAERPLQVRTATAHLQVIGKRHYGRKAAPPGGGGGQSATRELFDTLLAWRGRVPLDANGRASLEVPLNDSLSAFRITAIGAQGDGLFGSGSATVRTHRDLMLFAGVPEIGREGDAPRATATVRNAAERALEVTVSGEAVPVRADGTRLPALPLPARPVALAAGAATELAWPVTVPSGVARLEWSLRASAPGVPADAMRVVTRVLPGRAEPAVQQSTLLRLDGPQRLSVQRPRDAVAGVGEVRVALASTLVGGLAGVREYFAAYPYVCLEQRVSRAVGLDDAAAWRRIGGELPAYLDGDGLARFFPVDSLRGSDVLTAYLLSIAHAAGYEIPEEARTRMLDALAAFAEGRLVARDLYRPGDLTLRRLGAYEALARHGQLTPAMVEPLSIQPELWPTAGLLHWIHALEHAAALPDRDARLATARGLLRTRLTFAASRLVLSGERDEGYWWLLDSPDENAVRTLLASLDAPEFRDDVPRLASGALGRQQRGHWDTTLANAWGSVAVRRFAQRYESAAVGGATTATLGDTVARHAWAAAGAAEGATHRPAARDGTPAAEATLALPWPESRRAPLALAHAGSGAPWATVQSVAAVPVTRSFAAGYRLTRRVEPVQVAQPGRYTRGDLLRVVIDVEARQDMNWVALTDPIPAGALITGGTARSLAPLGAEGDAPRRGAPERAWPAFVERGFASYRAYFDYLPKGTWRVEYTLRLNAAGDFVLPPTRIEAMYAPDLYGVAPNAPVRIAAP